MHNRVLLLLAVMMFYAVGCVWLPTGLKTTETTLTYLEVPLPAGLEKDFQQALELMKQGKTEPALATFKRLHFEYPAHSGAAVNIAILIQANNPAEAMSYLNTAIERQAANYFAINRLGVLKRQANDFLMAGDLFQQAITINKNYAPAWYNFAVLNEVYLGKPQVALEAYTEYLKLVAEPDESVEKRLERLNKQVNEDS